MNRIIGIFLFCCLTVPFLGTYLWLQGRLQVIKHHVEKEIKKGTGKEVDVLFKFSLTDSKSLLDWEHSREFEYQDEMYDVLRSDTIGDTAWYWCYWDRKETKVKRDLHSLVANSLDHGPFNQTQQQHLNHFFKNLYCYPKSEMPEANDHLFQTKISSDYLDNVSDICLIPPIPPPERI